MQGLGALTLCAVENLYITLQSALCKGVPNPWIQPISDHAELFSLKKKKRSAYKWTQAVQAHVIQGSTVFYFYKLMITDSCEE